MNELSKFRGPAAFRVDPGEGPSWLTFRCEEDLRESGVITEGDKVIALSEPMALRERAEPDYIRYDCGCCGWETIEDWRDNDACPKCNHKPMGKTELYAAPPAPVVPDAIPKTESQDGNDICCMEPSAIYALGKKHGWNDYRDTMLAAAPGKEG